MSETFDQSTGEIYDPNDRASRIAMARRLSTDINWAGRFGDTAKLAAALAKAQGVIEDAVKDATNPHFKSKFADLASVRAAIRQPLSDNGIAYVQLVRSGGKAVEVETLLLHDSGQVIGDTLTIPLLQNTPQAVGSAISYGRRYSLMSIVGLAADDDDAEAAQGRGSFAARTSNGSVRKSSAAAKRDGDWDKLQADIADAQSAVSLQRLWDDYRRNEYPKWNQDWRREADEVFQRSMAEFSQGDALQETMQTLIAEPQTRAEYIQHCHNIIATAPYADTLLMWWNNDQAARKRFSLTKEEVFDLKARVVEKRKELAPEAPHGRDTAGRPLDLVADAG